MRSFRFLIAFAVLGVAGCEEATPQYKSVRLKEIAHVMGNLCGISDDNQVVCWAEPEAPAEDIRITRGYLPPAVPAGLAGNSLYACFLSIPAGAEGGWPYCWGFGTGTQVPERFKADEPLRGISTGYTHTCGLGAAGTAYCAGYNSYGQLGTGSTRSSLDEPLQLEPDRAASKVTVISEKLIDIAAGLAFTCVVTSGNVLSCFGDARMGQLATDVTRGYSLHPVTNETMPLLGSIEASDDYACGITLAKSAVCWGANKYHQSGADSPASFRSIQVPGEVVQLELRPTYACARTATSEVYCWGSNGEGQIGAATLGKVISNPVKIPGVTGSVSDIALTDIGGHALVNGDRVASWGNGGAARMRRVVRRVDIPVPAQRIE